MNNGGNLLPHIHKEVVKFHIYLKRPEKESNDGDIKFSSWKLSSDNINFPSEIIDIRRVIWSCFHLQFFIPLFPLTQIDRE